MTIADMVKKAKLAGGVLAIALQVRQCLTAITYAIGVWRQTKLTKAIHRQYLEVFRDRDARVIVLHALAKAILASGDFYARLSARTDRLRAYPTLIIWGMKDSAFQPHQLARWETLLPQAEAHRP